MKIALSVALAFLFVGCVSQDEKKEVKQVEQKKVVKEQSSVQTMLNTTTTKVIEVPQTVEEEIVPKALATIQEATRVVEKQVKKVIVSSVSGESIFKSCSSCHGQNAEKKALGKSQIIKGWDATKVAEALNGYKAGIYGGSMKGLMKGQVLKLSDEDIKAVSGYISKL